ncbi:MAG: SDR family oxidoreductase [Thermoplasmata archaeon]|nr:SDR family oxidoreductase [Thermoplasmata archaeon]
MQLSGKVALVTRAGSDPIGRGIAAALALEGACVVVADLDERQGRATAAAISLAGGQASFIHADLGKPQDCAALLAGAERLYGGLDALVNVLAGEPLDAPAKANADRAQSNLLAALRGTVRAVETLRMRGGGSVLHIGSTTALGLGTHVSSPARVAGAAIPHLASRLAGLGQEGIRVNCLAYGWLATPELTDFVERLTTAQRLRAGVPASLTPADGVVKLGVQFVSDASLSGRVAFWAGGSEPVWLASGREYPSFRIRASVPTQTVMGPAPLSDGGLAPLGRIEPSPSISTSSWAFAPHRPKI